MSKKVRFYLDDFKHSAFDNVKFGESHEFDAGELDCLWLDDVLNNVPIDKVDNVFREYVSLVKKGGTLIVNGTDIYEVSKALASYNISVQDANKLLYEGGKANGFNISFVIDTLKSYGLKIITKRISNFKYSVEAER